VSLNLAAVNEFRSCAQSWRFNATCGDEDSLSQKLASAALERRNAVFQDQG